MNLRRAAATMTLLSALGMLPTSLAGAATPVDDQQRRVVLADLNAVRAQAGVPALASDPRLQTVAQGWADQLAATGGVTGLHNPNFFEQINASTKCWSIGEVVAGNGGTDVITTGHEAVGQWMASPSHRTIMLRSDRRSLIGVGVAHGMSDGMEMTWWVADMAGDCDGQQVVPPGVLPPTTPTPAPTYNPGPTIGTPMPQVTVQRRTRAHR